MDENKSKALQAALSQIEKQFGKNTVMRLGDNELMGEMKKINEGQQEALKAILTPEQLEKYKTMQSQMRAGGPPRN